LGSSVPVVPNGDIPELAKWLSEIPKPAAVMAAYDDRASNVLSAAEEASIPVPDQLNVIGVDNDGLICDFTNPPLSSIWPDHEALGARAAGELARLMEEGGGTTSMTIRVRAMRVVTRDTTGFATPSARIVERALAFIGKNAALPLTPDDVARALRVSRRLADLRFHEQAGTTLAEAISEARLALVAKQLTETDEPIGRIARKLSFPNVNSLGNRFRARYGLSMREWRKR
jgi:LacI family transcriptional regulator